MTFFGHSSELTCPGGNKTGQLCIVANSDIYFDHTLRYLLQFPITRKFLALSRVDVTKGVHLNFNEWTAPVSQDTWIFNSPRMINLFCVFLEPTNKHPPFLQFQEI